MAKGWVEMGSNAGTICETPAEKRLRAKRVAKLLRNVKSLSVDELKAESEAYDKRKVVREASWDAANKAGKVTLKKVGKKEIKGYSITL